MPQEMATMRGLAPDLADVEQALRHFRRDGNQLGAADRQPVPGLQTVEDGHDLADVVGAARLGDDVPMRPSGDRLLEIGDRVVARDRVHPDPAFLGAEIERLEPAPDDRARGRLLVRRDGVLQIEDEPIRGQRQRLLHHLLVAAGDEVQGAPHDPPSRRRIMAARRQRITSAPCWFLARCSNMTMPHCGRDFDSRFSTTSVSE